MNYAEIFLTALNSLKSNILRTILTMLGIIIGIFAVTLVLIISQGATAAITSKISALGTNLLYIVSEQGINLTLDDATAIKQELPEIQTIDEEVIRTKTVSANGQSSSYSITGVTPAYFTLLNLNTSLGAFFTDDDVTSYATVAVIGSQVQTDLFGTNSNPVGQLIQIGNKSFYVIGVLPSQGSSIAGNPDTTIFIPVTTALSSIAGGTTLNSIEAYVPDPNQIDIAAKDVKQLLLDRHNVTDPQVISKYAVFTSKNLLATVGSITGILSAVLAGIAGISLLVGGIGIMNIMLVTVTERTREIGLLKAIGAKEGNILTQFLIEAVVLTVSGGLIGTLLGIVVGLIASSLLKVPFTPPYLSIIGSVIISIIIGLVFGIYPAKRAANMSPIDALRYE